MNVWSIVEKQERLGYKLDLEKAYNTMDSDFLDFRSRKGFGLLTGETR